MGRPFETSSGWWLRDSTTYKDASGKSKRTQKRTGPFDTEENALLYQSSQTVDSSVVEWLQAWSLRKGQELRKTNQPAYAMCIDKHIRVSIVANLPKNLAIADFRREHAIRIFETLLGLGKAPKTVTSVRGTLCLAVGDMVNAGLLPMNFIRDCSVRKTQPKAPKAESFTEEEFFQASDFLVDEPANWRWRNPFLMSLHFGLRRGEILGLKVGDFRKRQEGGFFIDIQRQVRHDGRGVWTETQPKTANGVRTLVMSDDLFEVLALDLTRKPSEYLFSGVKRGSHLSGNAMTKEWAKFVVRAGLNPDINLHKARNSYASFAMANGERLENLSLQLGHGDVRITTTYVERLRKQQAEPSVVSNIMSNRSKRTGTVE
jgi:integrase